MSRAFREFADIGEAFFNIFNNLVCGELADISKAFANILSSLLVARIEHLVGRALPCGLGGQHRRE